jgi:Lrp/AsnC family transcriptional regulator for asnA, asnC and gidA
MDLNNQLDYTDKAILGCLSDDSRRSYVEIANELKISNSLVHQRIRKMKTSGLIKKAGLQINEKVLGYHACSFTGIVLREAHYAQKVVDELEKIPEVVECDFVSGKYAVFIKIYAANNEHMREVLYEKIHCIEGVSGTDTFISFGSQFRREAPIK